MEAVAPPGFCNRGEVRYGSIGGLEYEVPQKLTHLLQCICRVIRSSSMTMKAHTYYIIFGRPPIGGKLPPWWCHCMEVGIKLKFVCVRCNSSKEITYFAIGTSMQLFVSYLVF